MISSTRFLCFVDIQHNIIRDYFKLKKKNDHRTMKEAITLSVWRIPYLASQPLSKDLQTTGSRRYYRLSNRYDTNTMLDMSVYRNCRKECHLKGIVLDHQWNMDSWNTRRLHTDKRSEFLEIWTREKYLWVEALERNVSELRS